MKLPGLLTTLSIFASLCWLGWSYVMYEMLVSGDCSYMNTEDCRARLRFEPVVIFWRYLAVQLLILIPLFVRKR